MTFANLTLSEFLAVFLPLTTVLIALYLYGRSQRYFIVSTLRFWPPEKKSRRPFSRKKIQEPLSFALQLLALIFLTLAIADLQFRSDKPIRHHVILIDASAWMQTKIGTTEETLMDATRKAALAYLNAIPSRDAVMLIRADGNSEPLTEFTTDRFHLRQVIQKIEPGWAALNLTAGVKLAADALELAVGDFRLVNDSTSLGEVTYIGNGRIANNAASPPNTHRIPFFRYIAIGTEMSDCGIFSLVAQRTPDDPTRWKVSVKLANNDVDEHTLRSEFRFSSHLLTTEKVKLKANSSREITFLLQTQDPGSLEITLHPGDAFSANDRVRIELPALIPRHVGVYSEQPSALRRLLTTIPNIQPEFHQSRQYDDDQQMSGLLVFEDFVPTRLPRGNAVLFNPPRAHSPITVKQVHPNCRITNWSNSHPVARGLRNKDVILNRVSVFEPGPNDAIIAQCAAGPVIVARYIKGNSHVFFGFHPSRAGLEKHLATPLLFANTMAWLLPETFRVTNVIARAPGWIEIEVPKREKETVQFDPSNDPALTWTVGDGDLRFYTEQPGNVVVRTSSSEHQFALTLPEAGGNQWKPPVGILRGVPPVSVINLRQAELWPWLTVVALLILGFEWRIFGRQSLTASSFRAGGSTRAKPLRSDFLQSDRNREQKGRVTP